MKLLLGGSPCTHWSIAQTRNRETSPEGLGWELFRNYLIAREKYKPDYFLYENNKSMSAAIREQITEELGVPPVLINSALVSAQNRQRLYWTNIPGVRQPEDKSILLRDILETGVCWQEKSYCLRANSGRCCLPHDIKKSKRSYAAEPINVTVDGKAHTLKAQYHKSSNANFLNGGGHFAQTGVAQPVRIGTIESNAKNPAFDSQQYRVYSPDGKSVTLCGQGGRVGAKTGLYAVPYPTEPLRVANINGGGQGNRIYSMNGKSCVITAQSGGLGGHGQGLYAIPADGKSYPVYEVRDGIITIKEKQYPIKLADGYYIIRKLTVTECKRLQTVPESYVFPVSDTQAYKMLGNGWTVDVIAHILQYAPGITKKPLEVLSMYDGMSCGHLALDKLGANITRYYATEIDKYAIQTTQHNFPDTIQLGDAFQVREASWNLGGGEGYGQAG